MTDFNRTGMFIDGANTFAAAKALGFSIDYTILLNWFKQNEVLVRASYYTAILTDSEGNAHLRGLVDFLSYNGYIVVSKPAKVYYNDIYPNRVKGNMDIELCVDSLRLANKIDHMILVSGDGDFTYLVRAVQELGVHVTVVSTTKSTPPMISADLRKQADSFIDLSDLKATIAKRM